LVVLAYCAVGLLFAFRRAQFDAQRHDYELTSFREELTDIRERRRKVADAPLTWNGFRKFVVKRKSAENQDICSFYLTPHDAKPIPEFKPGQYLTFQLTHPQKNSPLVRCYSLSDRPNGEYYRVSIKRAITPNAPDGVGSGMFHDRIKEGDILDVRAPAGHFFLELANPQPLVLIAGGIGITPMLSMLATLVHQKSRREVWFFYGIRNSNEYVFVKELAALARDNPYLRLRVCFSQPGEFDRPGEDFHLPGRVNVELLKRELPSNNFLFYYCGPGPMMESLTNDLKAWGVPEAHLHYETFGPSSVKRVSQATTPPFGTTAVARFSVKFRKSAKTLTWIGSHGSLLELAESAGVAIASGCRAGNCGTCVVALQSGEVSYIQPPGSPPEARTCLACIAQPKGDLELDA
jgi:ferredoxin-NADP reductase